MLNAKERRVRIVRIDEKLIVSLLNWMKDPCGCLALPAMDDVPHDCEVVRVVSEPLYQSIDVLVYHPSFSEVEPYCVPPKIGESSEPMRVFFYKNGEWKTDGENK
jgi:hypothetical protein